jgi:phosphonate transport system substrate-binding protein
VPSVEAGSIELELKEFDTKLGQLLGHEVESHVVLSYTACIEQMGAGHFEAALLPTLAYVFAHDRYNARVVLKAVRSGSPTYRGEIITRVDSGINSLQDLKGRTFGFVDPSSASGCLYPKTLLITSGINPDTDLAEVTYIGSHPAVVEAVLQGRVDAGACFDDARERLVETEQNIMQETKVVAYTPAIPSDTVTFREDCVGPFYNRLVQALVELSKEGKEGVLYRIYQIEELVPAQDTDYDPIRQMIQTLDLDLASEIDKKG